VASLQIPVLLMTGDHSTAAAQAVTQRLSHLLPHARCQVVLGAGHMGPVTHAQAVARRIVDFLYTMQ
jgi:pimeloyl-ACP methyl ester carboxylesterase